MALVLKKRFLFIFGLIIILAQAFNAMADIPYVHGVDYFPEHYNGYFDDVNKNVMISDDNIEKDMYIMSQDFDAIRTYEYDVINLQRIIRTAKRYDMKVVVGIGVRADDTSYTDSQVSGLDRMFTQYPDLLDSVIAIIIGDEAIRNSQNIENDFSYLMTQFKKVAKFDWSSKINLGISETDNTYVLLSGTNVKFGWVPWRAGKTLLPLIPNNAVLFVNINPYMAGCSENAAIGGSSDSTCKDAAFEKFPFKNGSFPNRWARLMTLADLTKHQIVVGESGWPTDGPGATEPMATRNGDLNDAIDYYKFLYTYLESKQINNRTVAVPFFAFAAFDEPMRGVFGFASNFWGVYNFDSTPKTGMIYPLDRSVKSAPKKGTNLKIYLPTGSSYNSAKTPVKFRTKNIIYSNKPIKNKNNPKNFSFMDDYPFVEYSHEQSNVVILTLPAGKDKDHPAATCTNELISGNGYGFRSDLTLDWRYGHSKEDRCANINWAANGIWIN